jgi:hypothetical protein
MDGRPASDTALAVDASSDALLVGEPGGAADPESGTQTAPDPNKLKVVIYPVLACAPVSGAFVGVKPAPPSRKPARDFRLRTGSLGWRLKKPRSDPGLVSLLRARWLSILSMPRAPGSSCIGNCLRLQAHLVLEETAPPTV